MRPAKIKAQDFWNLVPSGFLQSKNKSESLLNLESIWKHLTSSTSRSTSDTSSESDLEATPAQYQLHKRDILSSKSYATLHLTLMENDVLAKLPSVIICGIKIHKKSEVCIIEEEVEMLEAVRAFDPEKNDFKFQDRSYPRL